MSHVHQTNTDTMTASFVDSDAQSRSGTGTMSAVLQASTSPFEHVIATALRATYWKASADTSSNRGKNSDDLVVGVAVEIERRCRVFDTPVTITIHDGIVTPTVDAESLANDIPVVRDGDVSVPGWASESVEHAWLEVNAAGTGTRLFVDPSVPPQVTAQPDDAAMDRPLVVSMRSPGDTPIGYASHENTAARLSTERDVTVPWTISTETWPFGTPPSVSRVPTDGGDDIAAGANSIVEIDARDGLTQLPSDSVDLIITSPPYRLQRNYPEADAVWDASPDCEHTWVTEQLYTDTPIRSEGGAGFQSSDDPAELRRDRWRDSTACAHCGAWKGQLGLEPTLDQYIQHLVTIFEQAKRVLKPTGSLWVNIGDSYADGHRNENGEYRDAPEKALAGVPPKFELAMRDTEWIPRERCAWVKPSPTPDPAHDRRTPAWEHIFRFTNSTDYTDATDQTDLNVFNLDTASGETSHSAPMPKSLPETIIDSTFSDDESGVVLDPFAGSGTVLEAAVEADHDYIGFEISTDAVRMARQRVAPYNREVKSLTGQSSLTSFTN